VIAKKARSRPTGRPKSPWYPATAPNAVVLPDSVRGGVYPFGFKQIDRARAGHRRSIHLCMVPVRWSGSDAERHFALGPLRQAAAGHPSI
jgi:hypothetical protein